MSEHRTHCILDANVIFDLHAGDILEYPCSLPYILHTTDFVLDEIESISLAELEGCGLTIVELPSEMVVEVHRLRPQHLALSLADLSVFVYARHSGHMVLTGDGPLWTFAQESGIDVHGTLWLLDLLVGQGILTRPNGSQALQRMTERKRWLPRAEVQKKVQGMGEGITIGYPHTSFTFSGSYRNAISLVLPPWFKCESSTSRIWSNFRSFS